MPSTRSTLNLKRKTIGSLQLNPIKRQPRVTFKLFNFTSVEPLDGEFFPIFGKTAKSTIKSVPVVKFEDIEETSYLCVRKFFYETRTYSSEYYYIQLPQFPSCPELPELNASDVISAFNNISDLKEEDSEYLSDSSSDTLPVPHGESYSIEQ